MPMLVRTFPTPRPWLTWASAALSALAANSRGVLGFPGPKASPQNSALLTMVLTVAAMSPPVCRKVSAQRATRDAGGASATKRWPRREGPGVAGGGGGLEAEEVLGRVVGAWARIEKVPVRRRPVDPQAREAGG